ncbi:hypothetical protein BDR26DRAFT_874907 [Obelidium mucronatum]|nr:hypothetical protein BDR26DRAFT_874907 [Obelidium mucronatum]
MILPQAPLLPYHIQRTTTATAATVTTCKGQLDATLSRGTTNSPSTTPTTTAFLYALVTATALILLWLYGLFLLYEQGILDLNSQATLFNLMDVSCILGFTTFASYGFHYRIASWITVGMYAAVVRCIADIAWTAWLASFECSWENSNAYLGVLVVAIVDPILTWMIVAACLEVRGFVKASSGQVS